MLKKPAPGDEIPGPEHIEHLEYYKYMLADAIDHNKMLAEIPAKIEWLKTVPVAADCEDALPRLFEHQQKHRKEEQKKRKRKDDTEGFDFGF